MFNLYKKEILKLLNKKHVNNRVYQQFLTRLQSNKLTQETNQEDHFCSFFLPVNLKSKSVYLGFHKKANDWIPPGGHIKYDETPIQTVYREFIEELNFKLSKEKIELFDLSIKDVSGNPFHSCKIHYDFWYLVFTEKYRFKFEKREFYQGGWFTLKQALTKTKLKQYNEIIATLDKFYRL